MQSDYIGFTFNSNVSDLVGWNKRQLVLRLGEAFLEEELINSSQAIYIVSFLISRAKITRIKFRLNFNLSFN